MRNKRRPLRRRLVTGLVLSVALLLLLGVASSGGSVAASVPRASQPVTIGYSGTFTMSNTASPQGTTH